eukprot:COSAG02_NODE_20241_length_841_cov_1.454178_1_plen_43_part_10
MAKKRGLNDVKLLRMDCLYRPCGLHHKHLKQRLENTEPRLPDG